MSKSIARVLLGACTALVLAATVTGCAGPGSAAPETVATTQAAASAPTPMPIEEVVDLDPLAEPLVAAGKALVAGTEGFAPVEARTTLDVAVQQLDADVQVAQLSAAGGPAASQATPPVDEARIAADIAALYAAAQLVRQGVVDTASRVLNEETPDADQAVRDDLYLAVVAQQAAGPATDDTPRQLLELVAKTRAAQDAQAAGAAAREAAEQSAADGESASGGGSGPTYTEIPFCYHWPPLHITDPLTGEPQDVTPPPSGPGC
ncbi:hypothetical protein [Herbiconiux ginsengi]|nr:hypothetical protein [Herbiconiux ginsengi]